MHATGVVTRLAWRNLWRNYRRTLIMLGAIAVGVWAMMFMNALLRGMINEMIRTGVEALPGHVQIHHPGYRGDPSVMNSLTLAEQSLAPVLENPGVTAWTSRVRVPAVVSSERESRGVTLVGIDPASEVEISFLSEQVAEGRFLEDVADEGLLIGRSLLEKLDTDLGKRVALLSQDQNNDIADRGFRIVGVYTAELDSIEDAFVFTGRATAQRLLRIGDQVQEVALLGTSFRGSIELAEQLSTTLPATAGSAVDIAAWNELDSYLGTLLNVMDGFVLVWIVIVFLALSFGLVNTLVMAVFERVREIGLMLALGMRPRLIVAQIMVESLLLLLLGLGLGNVLAWLTIAPLADGIDISMVAEGMEVFGAGAVLYPQLTSGDMLLANSVVIALGLVASLSPAWRASRYEPVQALAKV